MGKHQIMSVPKEARGTSDWDMFATWVGANADNGTWFIGGVIAALRLQWKFWHCRLPCLICFWVWSATLVTRRAFRRWNRVEYFFNFGWFCYTFETARPEFEPAGRQKRVIFPVFCLLSRPRGPDLKCPVDKKESFPLFFVYFLGRTPRIWTGR